MKTTNGPLAPLVFIHTGNSWYLPYTIWQAKQLNPISEIYFIGDRATRHFSRYINHVDVSQYEHSIERLRHVYRHHSKLGEAFEFMCIARWFVLLDFMKQRNIEQCTYLDSDILVYEDLTEAHKKLQPHDMTWCSFSAHTNFISNREALQHYCNNVIDLYTNNFPETLKSKSLYHQVLSGAVDMNISDMTFFHDYNARYPNSLLALNHPNLQGTYDISMEDTRVFEDDGRGFKKIYWQGKIPYCKVKETQELVPFVTLHFQGKGKGILKKHFNTFDPPFLVFFIKNVTFRSMQKLKCLIVNTHRHLPISFIRSYL